MTIQQPDMLDRCTMFAHGTLRQGKAKGLDREALSLAFIAEGIIELVGVQRSVAVELTRNCIAYAVEKLQFDALTSSTDTRDHAD